MSQVIYTYPDNIEVTKEIHPNAHKTYGDKVNGSRPIKAEILGEVSDEFLYKHLRYVLNPRKRIIIHNGKTILELSVEY